MNPVSDDGAMKALLEAACTAWSTPARVEDASSGQLLLRLYPATGKAVQVERHVSDNPVAPIRWQLSTLHGDLLAEASSVGGMLLRLRVRLDEEFAPGRILIGVQGR